MEKSTSFNIATSAQPLSQSLEKQCLARNITKLPFRAYLENGYTYYLHWLYLTLGLPDNLKSHLNFSVARNINADFPIRYPMGIDLEIRYLLHRLENLFGKDKMAFHKDAIIKALQETLRMSDIEAAEYVAEYLKKGGAGPLTLSKSEFLSRLKNVPTQLLDAHSKKTWRLDNYQNQPPYPISRQDIVNGESIGPPSSRHLGLQMLNLNGYMDFMPSVAANLNSKSFKPSSIKYLM